MNNTLSTKMSALSAFPILSSLNKFELENLANRSDYKKLDKGERVYDENSNTDYVYFLANGKIKLASDVECGKTLIKDIIHKESVFGENIFIEGSTRSEYAIAVEQDTIIYKVSKRAIMDLLVTNEVFSAALTHLVMTRLHNLEQRMKNFIFLKAKSRIGEFLSRMGHQRGVRIGLDEWLINHGLSHKEIAYMTDTSRQTVARILGEFKKDNLIHFSARKPSKILIRDIVGLRAS